MRIGRWRVTDALLLGEGDGALRGVVLVLGPLLVGGGRRRGRGQVQALWGGGRGGGRHCRRRRYGRGGLLLPLCQPRRYDVQCRYLHDVGAKLT